MSQAVYRPGASPMYPYELADFVERFVAYIIDGVIVGIITLPVSFILGGWTNSLLASAASDDLIISILWVMLVSAVITFVFQIIYFTILEGGEKNATFGKRLIKIRVMDEHRRPIGMRQAFIRNLCRFTFIPGISALVLIIDVILILTTDTKQRIGDRLAHTVVVKDMRYTPYPPPYNPYYAQQYYPPPNMPYFQHPPYQPSRQPYPPPQQKPAQQKPAQPEAPEQGA